MTDDRVYIRFKGKTLGPLTLQKVQELAKRGQITRMHDLSSDGITWVKAEEFDGVFHSAAVAIVTASTTGNSSLMEAVAALPAGTATVAAQMATPRLGEAPDLGVEWYAHIGGQNRGPMNTTAIQAAITNGQVTQETLVWRAGFEDWKPAGVSLPQSFGQPANALNEPNHHSALGTTNVPTHSGGVGGDLFYELHRQRPWVLLIAGLILAYGVLNAVFWLGFMIVGVNSQLTASYGNSAKVITGLIGLTIAAVIICGGWLLLHYAAALKDMAIRRNPAMPCEAAKRLYVFWRYVGIGILTLFGFFIIGFVVMMVMAAGAGAGAVTP